MHKKEIKALYRESDISDECLKELIGNRTEDDRLLLAELAQKRCREYYGDKVFIRGLIEISSICGNDCLYCGLRRSNKSALRYRLTEEEILLCCKKGYKLGFRTFVMQGGEDAYFTDGRLCEIIKEIKLRFPDCAVTLSLGERSGESYQRLFEAGADRYLLRHETADEKHYAMLHPKEMSLKNRTGCLENLKRIGYQTGCGFMAGSPFQTVDNLVRDLRFIKEFKPHMVGIGPFIPHKDTPFRDEKAGNAELTLFLLSVVRLMNPSVLLPATTALSTVSDKGREKGILAGANVIMPNLSPMEARIKYELYDNKAFDGEEGAEGIEALKERMRRIGKRVVIDRGDWAECDTV